MPRRFGINRLFITVCALPGGAAGRSSSNGAGTDAVGPEPLAQTFMVSESSGAACLDGSLPRYWVQPPTVPADANRWAVHMQGGGWW